MQGYENQKPMRESKLASQRQRLLHSGQAGWRSQSQAGSAQDKEVPEQPDKKRCCVVRI